jgi:hypothetical protein
MVYAGASAIRRVDMVEPVAALDAYRNGRLSLPPGYTVEYGADVLLLRRGDDSVVAAFNAGRATSSEVEKDAWNDHKRSNRKTA